MPASSIQLPATVTHPAFLTTTPAVSTPAASSAHYSASTPAPRSSLPAASTPQPPAHLSPMLPVRAQITVPAAILVPSVATSAPHVAPGLSAISRLNALFAQRPTSTPTAAPCQPTAATHPPISIQPIIPAVTAPSSTISSAQPSLQAVAPTHCLSLGISGPQTPCVLLLQQ